jgi:Pathogenicity locus
MAKRATAGDDLQRIPGVGPSIARELRGLGIRRLADLRGRDPETLYQRLNKRRGERQDPCVLYVFRCAVYFANTAHPRPERLKWWWWKDRPGL